MRILQITVLLSIFAVAACQSANDNSANNGSTNAAGSGAPGVDQNSRTNSEGPENSESDPSQSGVKSDLESVYTDLSEDKCEDVDIDEEESWSVQSCEGVAGYRLLVTDADSRQTIDIVAPDEKKSELNFGVIVSSGFSTVGDKAEWRVIKVNGKVKPIALIVRYNVSENPENADEVTSYLTVSKITDTKSCITDVVKPIKNANQLAKDLANAATEKPCMKKRS